MTDTQTRVTQITGSVNPEKLYPSTLSADIEKVINQYPPIDHRPYSIQINTKFKSTSINKKPDPRYVNGGNPTGIFWQTLTDVSLLAIKHFIESGYILRSGIKLNGTNYRKNFQYADFIYFDIDQNQKIQESIESEYLPATYIYKSPSYDDGLIDGFEKHRVFTRLSRRIHDPIQVEAIIRFYVSSLDYLDASCVDPARIMYGSLYPVVFYDPDACIDVDELETNDLYLSILNQVQSNNGKKVKESLTTTKDKKEKENKPLPIYAKLIEKLENEYNLDLNAFLEPLNLGYDFEFKRINPDHPDILYKWVGLNPFSGTNKSGTSLVCSIKDGKIIFYNRARTGVEDSTSDDVDFKHGASIFDFIACVRQKRETVATINNKEEFRGIAKELCNDFDLPLTLAIDLNGLDIVEVLEQFIHPELDGMVYRCKNVVGDMVAEHDIFLSYENDVWKKGFKNMCCSLFETTYLKLFGVMMSSKKHTGMSNGGNYEQFPLHRRLDRLPSENLDHFYFNDGMFDYQTKELKPYTPEVFNFYKVDYNYVSDRKKIKESLTLIVKALKASGVCRQDRKVIYLAFILTVHQKFHLAMKVLYFYGIKASGKSSLANIFYRIFPDAKFTPAEDVRKADKNFGKHLGRVAIWDEVLSMGNIVPSMMSFIRTATKEGITFTHEEKYQPSFQKVLPVTLIFTGENLVIGATSNVEGFTDRIVPVEFNCSQLGDAGRYWAAYWENADQVVSALVSAAATVNFKPEWIKKVNHLQLTNNSIYHERLNTLKESSDHLFGFIACFEADPLFNGSNFKDDCVIAISGSKLKEMYVIITGDEKGASYISVWNGHTQRIARKFKEINPIAINRTSNSIRKWYGIKLKADALAEYPQLGYF
jgi:hypothetical protein